MVQPGEELYEGHRVPERGFPEAFDFSGILDGLWDRDGRMVKYSFVFWYFLNDVEAAAGAVNPNFLFNNKFPSFWR